MPIDIQDKYTYYDYHFVRWLDVQFKVLDKNKQYIHRIHVDELACCNADEVIHCIRAIDVRYEYLTQIILSCNLDELEEVLLNYGFRKV